MMAKPVPPAPTLPEPVNTEAEDAVLASIIFGGSEALLGIDPPLDADDFYRESHRQLYIVMQLVDNPSDYIQLAEEAKQQGWAYTMSEHARLMAACPTDTYTEHYASIVRNLAAQRRLIAAGQAIVREGYEAGHTTEDRYRSALARIEAAALPEASHSVLMWGDTFAEYARLQAERYAHRNDRKLCLPWRALSWVRPLRGGMLAILAANSGIGKTVGAECCAEYWAREGFQVAFFHYELAHQIMLDRQMCRWSGEPMEVVESGVMTQRMVDAQAAMRGWPGKIHYVHCDGWPMTRIAAKARNMIHRGQAQVVIVDYLQKAPLVERVRSMNTAQMRGADAETLKSLAESEQVPVLALSQINREGAKAERKTRHELRDSGEIDEKANLVITLDREILKDDTTFGDLIVKAGSYSPKIKVRVDKQTLGRTGEEELIMNPGRFSIADIQR